jgi:hypothetical protein
MQTQMTFETHGPAVTNAAVWFVILNPVLAFIICAMAACLMK